MEKIFLNAEDIMKLTGIDKIKASEIIKEMNTELQSLGYHTFSDCINTQYFMKRVNFDKREPRKITVYKDADGKTRTVIQYFKNTQRQQGKNSDLENDKKADILFEEFIKMYKKDMSVRLKTNTWITKNSIIDNRIVPFFKGMYLTEITAKDIINWQNKMINHKNQKEEPFSPVYLKTLHDQLSALFNHAVKFYGLPDNPAVKAGNMGRAKNKEKLFWTKNEYFKFISIVKETRDELSYCAFEILYWTGIRLGELLALTPKDFDFSRKTLSVNKSFQRIAGNDVITVPKTLKSVRVINIPEFLSEEIKEYIKNKDKDKRIFNVTKNCLHYKMARYSNLAGVKRIPIHSLRHSHISHLIELGFSAVAIADRVGHESIDITYNYAHMFPSTQLAMAKKLDNERGNY